MAVNCDICGIEALESEEFALEQLPFRRAKRYCPACHRRFHARVYAVVAAVVILCGIFGIVDVWRKDKTVLQSVGLRGACFIFVQWLMVLPHELGHAVAARVLGYKQVRISVGFGRPLFFLNFLGFRWLFNVIPLGGITLPGPGTTLHRWKHLAVVAAGPMVNLLAAGLAMLFAGPGWAFHGLRRWESLFIWANLLVVAENLVPYVAQTQFGASGTDGYQLWHLLFRWNKRPAAEPEKVPSWELALCHCLKWLALLVTSITCLVAGFCAIYVLIWPIGSEGHKSGRALALVLATISFLCGWITVRIARNPIAKCRKRDPFTLNRPSFTPEQIELLKKANEEFARKDFTAVEKTYDYLLDLIQERNSEAFVQVLQGKILMQVEQGHVEAAESTCMNFVSEPVNKEYKIRLLDGLACLFLYKPSSPCLNLAEKLARLGLEIVPGTLTLKGTLGGILTEQGKFAEAEPLLHECRERSPAQHDQGISSVYLGFIKLHEGKTEEGRRLIDHGTTLYPEPWLVAKANAKLVGRPDVEI
jgi:hypothetical protein